MVPAAGQSLVPRCNPLEGAKHPPCPSAFQWDLITHQIMAPKHGNMWGIPIHTNLNYSTCNTGSPSQPQTPQSSDTETKKQKGQTDDRWGAQTEQITKGRKQTASTSVERRGAWFQLHSCKVVMGGREWCNAHVKYVCRQMSLWIRGSTAQIIHWEICFETWNQVEKQFSPACPRAPSSPSKAELRIQQRRHNLIKRHLHICFSVLPLTEV